MFTSSPLLHGKVLFRVLSNLNRTLKYMYICNHANFCSLFVHCCTEKFCLSMYFSVLAAETVGRLMIVKTPEKTPEKSEQPTADFVMKKRDSRQKTFACDVTTCAKFGKPIYCYNGIQGHIEKHHKQTVYKCTVCVAVFSDKANVLLHESIHETTPEKVMFRCDHCRYVKAKQADVDKHTLTCQSNKAVWNFCPYCPVSFLKTRPDKIKEHLTKKHPSKGPFFCADCFEAHSDRPSLVVHVAAKHPETVQSSLIKVEKNDQSLSGAGVTSTPATRSGNKKK